MKRSGLLHAELNRVIAAMGHTDTLVIGDVGLPVPHGVPCIDLAVLPGTPDFSTVFEAVYAELAVESVTVASESQPATEAIVAVATSAGLRLGKTAVKHFASRVCTSFIDQFPAGHASLKTTR